MLSYPWPGNVRELIAVMERAVLLGDGRTLEVATSLGAGARAPARGPADPRPAPVPTSAAAEPSLRLDAALVSHIERALAKSHGRIEGPHGAARLLEVNPHTLRARMRKLGIDWRRFRAR
jgi:transcriptional regulator with GAF, ATPase, and Fis domain